jgi:archaellum biogenesis protein FlaJ (TadC family)
MVGRIDKETAPFIRSLGNVAESLGSTVSVALEKVDRRSLDALEPYIGRLQTRLRRSIHPDKAWNSFRYEAGSALLNSSTRMFVDGVTLSGSPEKVGGIASNHALEIMNTFNSQISGAISELNDSSVGQGLALLPPLPVFQSQDMSSLSMITTVALVSLTIADSLSPKFAMVGSKLLMALFGSITCLMTGLNMMVIPAIARSVLLPDAT